MGADRRVLESMVESGSLRDAERASIVLACAETASNRQVAKDLGVSVTASGGSLRFVVGFAGVASWFVR